MKKLIYISGPITDNKTGQPREGWEKEFQEAEEYLRGLGFEVISPDTIAKNAEEQWRDVIHAGQTIPIPRWYYLYWCIEELKYRIGCGEILGLYVIGDLHDIPYSYGTMCEINFALAAGLPVWAKVLSGRRMDNMLWTRPGYTIEETAEKTKTTN